MSRDYRETSPGAAICTHCESYCTAFVSGHGVHTAVISACCDAPAEWESDRELIEPVDLWVHSV